MNDADIKTLINSAVDGELAGRRVPPAWNPADLLDESGRDESGPARLGPDRSGPARWAVPLLAASAVGLLAAGSIVAIDHSRGARSNPVGSAAPTPSPSLSLSQSTIETEPEEADRAYAEAMAGAREATEVAGVSVRPLSAGDAARLKGTGLMTGDISGITTPKPGTTYSFTLSYLAGPSNDWPAVLTTEVQDVASGSCAQTFRVRPGHAYVIRCTAMLLAGVTGKATLTLRTPTGATAGSMNLSDPAKTSTAPSASSSLSIPPDQAVTAGEFADSVAAAPEASKVAGVSDRSASGVSGEPGQGFGTVNGVIPAPKPGRSYPVTLLYVSGSDAPPVSVLTLRIEDAAASRCPGAFRTRPNHSYEIRCQVTFLTGRVAKVYYKLLTPQGRSTTGMTLDP